MKTRVAKRSIAGALIMAMLVMMLLPMSVSAATFKTLKPGKWATEDGEYYKIIIKKAGRLNFTIWGGEEADIRIYNNKQAALDHEWNELSDMVAVDKGTYYLYVNSGDCKYSFTPSSAPTNYSIAKAKALKANKKVYNVFTPKTNFMRWFKVTNPKKKKIVFWSNNPEGIVVLSSKLKRIPTIAYGAKVKYCTKKVIPKGTYYIGVKRWWYSENDDNGVGIVTSLRWK